MKFKNLTHGLLFLLTILMISSSALAVQQGNLDIVQSDTLKVQFRTISGGLCQDVPDDAGTPSADLGYRVWCTGPNGITTDLKACVVQFFDSDGNKLREDVLAPGENTVAAPISATYWQRFNCYEVPYSCSYFVSMGCGASGSYARCEQDQMLRVRTCSDDAPASLETERCIDTIECRDSSKLCTFTTGAWSSCQNGRQTRTIIESDCSTWVDTQPCVIEAPTGTTTGSGGTSTGGTTTGDANQTPPVLKSLGEASFYDPARGAVIGRIEIENTGGKMTETYLIEMQVVPKGGKTFSFVSEQKVCDPEYKTNVHKLFMLDSGEKEVVELFVSDILLEEGKEYDVYFLTRKKCYVNLTADEKTLGDNYWQVNPFKGYEKIGTVFIGSYIKKATSNTVKYLPVFFIIAGIVIAIWYMPLGLSLFAFGLLMFLIQNLLTRF